MMQFLLLVLTTAGGAFGTLVRGPFVPYCVYILYSVLRPQFLWKWNLASMPEVGWAFYISVVALGSYLPWVAGMFGSPRDPERYVHPAFVWSHRMMAGFALWVTLSYLFANDQYVARNAFEDMVKIFVMYFLGTQIVRMVWQVKVLYLVMAGSLAYIAADLVQLYVTTGRLQLVKGGYAGLDNNGAALMLAMGVPLCYFAFEFTKGWYRWLLLAPIPFIAESIMSSYSRGAMISAIVGSLFYVFFSRRKAVLAVGMVLAVLAVPVVAGKEIKERFASTAKGGEDDSINSRYVSWDCARRIANDYPVFGAGVRNSNLLTFAYGADMEGRAVHNNYLQLAADTGWIGMAWYVALGAFTMVALARARWRLRGRTDDEANLTVALIGGIFCSLVTFFFGAIFLSIETLELPYFLTLLGGQLWAIANAQVSRPPGERLPAVPISRRVAAGRWQPRPTAPGTPRSRTPVRTDFRGVPTPNYAPPPPPPPPQPQPQTQGGEPS
jgi:probable O-glycosylation ligase (exosortase A-associated)